MNQTLPAWTLANSVARLTGGPLEADVDVERPQLGLQSLRWRCSPLAAHVLGVRWESDERGTLPGRELDWPLRVGDVYVRADDLVATYLPESPFPFQPQLYWRANACAASQPRLATFSLLVSIQTELLDTRPKLSVVSRLAAEQLVHLVVGDRECQTTLLAGGRTHSFEPQAGMNCVLVRMPGGELTYSECVTTADFHQLRSSPPTDATQMAAVEWQLFNDFLEKGVIRRAQVHMMFLPRENDVQLVAECCRALKQKPLPLTT